MKRTSNSRALNFVLAAASGIPLAVSLVISLAISLAVAPRAAQATTNIELSPLSVLGGFLLGNINFAVGEKVAIGPVFAFGGNTYSRAWELGGRIDVAFSQIHSDTGYISGVAEYAHATADSGSSRNTASAVGFSALAGYHWFWASGFNIRLGAGLGYLSFPDRLDVNGNSVELAGYSGLYPRIEFNLGYRF